MTTGTEHWLERSRAFFPLTRQAYRLLADDRIRHMITAAEADLKRASTPDDKAEAMFALQELRAVLRKRG